jgi:hypothetical protein
MNPIDIGLVAAGLILAFAGAALFKYTVGGVGFLSGGAGGFMLASAVAPEPVTIAGATIVGGLVGVFLAFSLVSTVATIPGFLLGSYVAATVLDLQGAGLDVKIIGGTVLGGIVGAALCGLLFKKVLPIVTGFLGAALATRAWTVDAFSEAASSLDPSPVVFDPDPLFLGVFAVGALSQYGLVKLGWAKKIGTPAKTLWRRIRGGKEPTAGVDADTGGDPIAGETAGDDDIAGQ